MKKKIKVLFFVFGLLSLVFVARLALAQDYGIEEVGKGLDNALPNTGEDIRVTIGRIIQFALGFLGIIALLIIIYAGFKWMTSGGDEAKISEAKKTLINATIGLVIISSSWGLATWLIGKIAANVGANTSSLTYPAAPSGFSNPGAGAIGNCAVASIYPDDGQRDLPRNTSLLITFKEPLDLNTVCVNSSGNSCACDSADCNKINPVTFRLFKNDLNDACSLSSCPEPNTNVTDINVAVSSDRKILVLSPREYLGSNSGNTDYGFRITSALKKADGNSMFSGCGVDNLDIDFTVSDKVDLESPYVVQGDIFPPPDNQKDVNNVITEAVAATAQIKVNGCPSIYSPAKLLSVSPGASVVLDYDGSISQFKVSVPADSPGKAQLFNGENNALLGVADWNAENQAVFSDFLTITAENHGVGSIWEIYIKPETKADTLRVNNTVYTFSAISGGNRIRVSSPCNIGMQRMYIFMTLSSPDITTNFLGNDIVRLFAKVRGSSGNNIVVTSTSDKLEITPFSGGVDRDASAITNDKKDKPRNSAIQFSFNEAINPLAVSGSADEVSNFVRVVNYNQAAASAGSACSVNADCRSYKCDNSTCVGNYVDGNFSVSNAYKTVEFVSNEECGMNGCGETIYCLPADSRLRVEINAANLRSCASNNDCIAFSPYNSCAPSVLGYNTCQAEANNYPLANVSSLDGVVDVANNSLDGNRDTYASGPLSFYNENNPVSTDGDGYQWSFFINEEINSDPPVINLINPSHGDRLSSLAEPIYLSFNKLMLSNTLSSGSISVFNGQDTYDHKKINLRSASAVPYGFSVYSQNYDKAPMDGEMDHTVAIIKHTPLPESMSFYVQVGSGVKDIYQNCYKPSTGPGCTATDASCCFGNPVTELDANGNCLLN